LAGWDAVEPGVSECSPNVRSNVSFGFQVIDAEGSLEFLAFPTRKPQILVRGGRGESGVVQRPPLILLRPDLLERQIPDRVLAPVLVIEVPPLRLVDREALGLHLAPQ
jgi:hypothetical protein